MDSLTTTLSSNGQSLQQTETAHNILITIIQSQIEKEEEKDIWKNSPYKNLVKLQKNNVGNVGEEFINNICKVSGIDVNINGVKTKKKGGGEGDGTIMDISSEIKTAHQGCSTPSFQHELGEVPWKSKYMIFVDIAPECIYLTIFKNFSEEIYKSNKKLTELFPTKTITWRTEGKGAFKLDTTVNINESNVASGHAIKVISTTPNVDIASFIRKIVV